MNSEMAHSIVQISVRITSQFYLTFHTVTLEPTCFLTTTKAKEYFSQCTFKVNSNISLLPNTCYVAFVVLGDISNQQSRKKAKCRGMKSCTYHTKTFI